MQTLSGNQEWERIPNSVNTYQSPIFMSGCPLGISVLHLSNCMLVPKLNVNLVFAQLENLGYGVSFKKTEGNSDEKWLSILGREA